MQRLGDCVGWRVQDSWISYGDLTFTLEAPVGHLPLLHMGVLGIGVRRVRAFLNRIESCLSDDLRSESGIDYTRLRDLLAVGQWQEADRETATIMQKVLGSDETNSFQVKHIEKFPCTDLSTIDRLWTKYSNGRFGFSTQKQLFNNLVSTNEINIETWCSFGVLVGWHVHHTWLPWPDHTFTSDAPRGHLPSLLSAGGTGLCGLGFGLSLWFSALASRLENCQLLRK